MEFFFLLGFTVASTDAEAVVATIAVTLAISISVAVTVIIRISGGGLLLLHFLLGYALFLVALDDALVLTFFVRVDKIPPSFFGVVDGSYLPFLGDVEVVNVISLS